MPELLIIADDMTGAIELGAFFAAQGVTARVQIGERLPEPGALGGIAVFVIDTESRHIGAEAARAKVAQIAAAARRRGVPYIYKKTDSVLRGNVAAELGALISEFRGEALTYLPAYPAMGRTCKGGRLFVHGKPVHETDFARDPMNPVADDSVIELLRRGGLQARLAAGPESLKEIVLEARPGEVIVCDGDEEAELYACAEVLQEIGMMHLTAGPGGFGEVLAKRLPLPRGKVTPPPKVTKTVTICGSANEVSLGQVERAREAGFCVVTVAPEELLGQEEAGSGKSLSAVMCQEIGKSDHVVIRLVESREDLNGYWEYFASRGIDRKEASGRVIERLGEIVRAVVKRSAPEALIVFGGDTAASIVRGAAIRPQGELMPALPYSQVEIAGRGMWLISKPGSFGPADVLARIKALIVNAG